MFTGYRLRHFNKDLHVGNTTTALNLAAAISESAGSVLLVDADLRQSTTEIAHARPLPFEVRLPSRRRAGCHRRDPRLRHNPAEPARPSR
jgi:hypothetical protein